MPSILALIVALGGWPGPYDLWIGVAPTQAKAQLMVQRFRQTVAKTKASCGTPSIRIDYAHENGQDFFWSKVRTYPDKAAPCAKASVKTWLQFNSDSDGGRTVYAYTYQSAPHPQ